MFSQKCAVILRQSVTMPSVLRLSRSTMSKPIVSNASFRASYSPFAAPSSNSFKKVGQHVTPPAPTSLPPKPTQPKPTPSTKKTSNNSNPKRAKIIYSDSPDTLNPFINKSGPTTTTTGVGSSPAATAAAAESPSLGLTGSIPPKPKVFNTPAEGTNVEQEAVVRTASGGAPIPRSKKSQQTDSAMSTLQQLRKIQSHPAYQLTRGFALLSIIYFFCVRVRDATPSPSEQYGPDASISEIIFKWGAKTQRVLWYTLKRVWSPFKTDAEVAREIMAQKRKDFLNQSQIPLDIELEPVYFDTKGNEYLD